MAKKHRLEACLVCSSIDQVRDYNHYYTIHGERKLNLCKKCEISLYQALNRIYSHGMLTQVEIFLIEWSTRRARDYREKTK